MTMCRRRGGPGEMRRAVDGPLSPSSKPPGSMVKSQGSRTARRAETAANVGYESQLWQMADALRGSMDAAEYKHVCLGLIFLKYISDAFEERHAKLLAEEAEGADPED